MSTDFTKSIGKVVMAKLICRVCQKTQEDIIIMQTRGGEDRVSFAQGKIVDFMEEPCAACKNHMKIGVIIISVADNDPNHRTGGYWVIKEEAVTNMPINEDIKKQFLEARVGLMAHSVCEQFGLFEAIKNSPASQPDAMDS